MYPTPFQKTMQGFTLVEVMVALMILAIMSGLSWRAIDALVRSQQHITQQQRQLTRLQAGMEQWQTDWNQLHPIGNEQLNIQFDGLSMRLLRMDSTDRMGYSAGLRVVAWTVGTLQSTPSDGFLANSNWLQRWQSPPLTDPVAIGQAWIRADQWARGQPLMPGDSQTAIVPVQGWHVFFYRSGAWSHPQSATDTYTTPPSPTPTPTLSTPALAFGLGNMVAAPEGVRLVLDGLTLSGVSGTLQWDWSQPQLSP